MTAVESPTFMNPKIPNEMPEPDMVVTGMEVMIVEPRYRSGVNARGTLAVLSSKARVWGQFEESGGTSFVGARTWKLRLDGDRSDGSSNRHYATRWRTLEEHRFAVAESDAREFLRSQGICPDRTSSWFSGGDVIALARLVWLTRRV
jgi:hypothetical protein